MQLYQHSNRLFVINELLFQFFLVLDHDRGAINYKRSVYNQHLLSFQLSSLVWPAVLQQYDVAVVNPRLREPHRLSLSLRERQLWLRPP